MFNAKKGRIMRHPYATLLLVGLATVGAISIGEKVKGFCSDKTRCVGDMIAGIRENKNPTV